MISKIGGVDKSGKYLQPEELKREHILKATEINKMFSVGKQHCYQVLKKACKRLMNKSLILEIPELKKVREVNVCSMAEYNEGEGSISIKFTDDIMPYLYQVKERFSLYNLKEVSNFSSLYTTRLYELLQEFKDTGWMIKSVDQLRHSFAVGNKFTKYGNFKKRTFFHACEEINKNYAMDLQFEEVKERRKVTAIKFTFKPTVIHQATSQKTENTKNLYEKPQMLETTKRRRKTIKFKTVKTPVETKPKIKQNTKLKKRGILSSMFSKLFG